MIETSSQGWEEERFICLFIRVLHLTDVRDYLGLGMCIIAVRWNSVSKVVQLSNRHSAHDAKIHPMQTLTN